VESTILGLVKIGGFGMAEYAILRVQKLKSAAAIMASLKHTFREQPTPNADPKKLVSNTLIGATSTVTAIQEFNDRLPDKVRKNGVLALEYLITASPEKMHAKSRAEQDAYLTDSLTWLKEKHGAENVFCAAVHRDETTPHLVAYVMPKDEKGKLNCRKFLGDRGALSELQTDFADRVGKRHGLERGILGSKAKHERVSRFYGLITQEAPRSDSKTIFGNVKPEAHAEVKNALEVLLAREKAIKQREAKLKNIEDRLRDLTEKARVESERRIQIECENDALITKKFILENRLEELEAKFKAVDEARMEYIDLSRHYQSLLKDKGLDYEF